MTVEPQNSYKILWEILSTFPTPLGDFFESHNISEGL